VTLSNAPLISPPYYDRDYILYLSSSVVSVEGVLVQLGDDGRKHVIYYINKNLSRPPLKYNHDEKLSLTVVLVVQKLCHYILLLTTKVIVDSNPMQYLLSRRQINGKFARWIIILQEYDLEFSTPKSKKALILIELITTFPSDAWALYTPSHELLHSSGICLGSTTNNQEEYVVVIGLLVEASHRHICHLNILLDS
jgi:hypothetical protein